MQEHSLPQEITYLCRCLLSLAVSAAAGSVFAQTGTSDPISGLTAHLSQAPDDADANYDLGFAYFRLGRLREARPFLDRAAQLAPSKADAWKALGLLHLRLNNYAEAVAPLRRACELGADTCYLEGRALFLLGRYDEAVKPLEQATENAPPADQSKVHQAVAMNFDRLGDPAQAEQHFSQAIRAFHAGATGDDPRIAYGAFLIRHARAAEAVSPLEQALAGHPESLRANAELGRALLDLDRPEEAISYLRKAVASNPKDWAVRMQLGKAYLRLGRTEEGEKELRVAREAWARENQGSSKVQ